MDTIKLEDRRSNRCVDTDFSWLSQVNKLATTVQHLAIEVSARHRSSTLEDVITFYGKGSHAIVFTQTKRECDELAAGQAFKTLTSQVGPSLFQLTQRHQSRRFTPSVPRSLGHRETLPKRV